MTTDGRFVVFADILGFAELCEHHPIDIDGLTFMDRILSPGLNIIEHFQRPKNPLTEVFAHFHYSLKWILDMAAMGNPLTAITFSDSVFVATSSLSPAIGVAVDLVQALLPQKIPVRIGIAHGSFAALRFKSDITPTSGDHAAQFLGASVVRAHATETCGVKGIRILLHPSVMPFLNDVLAVGTSYGPSSPRLRYIECPEHERLNKVGVTHEIDYWQFAPTKEAAAWRGLQDMWSESPPSATHQYEATAMAINRMRVARGSSALRTLRRRTLPK